MKIGIAGPVDLARFQSRFPSRDLPATYATQITALLAEELLDIGHEVSIFALGSDVPAPVQYRSGKLTINIGRFRQQHRARDFFRQERRDLVDLMRRDPCDVLHAHWTYEFAVASLAVDPFSLITVRDWPLTILRLMPDPYRFVRTVLAARVFQKGRFFTANSPYLQKKIQTWCRKPAEVVPNGIGRTSFSQPRRDRGAGGTRVISINNGFFGRKNLPVLLQAFKAIRSQTADCRLLLVGSECEEGSEGYRWAERNGLLTGVSFLGRQPYSRVEELLAEADLLIHPSLEESFGMTLVEAMAKGVPVIGGRRSGAVPWVLDQGDAGVLVDVKNPQEIAAAATGILRSPARREELGKKGFAFAKNNFAMPAVAGRFCELYETIRERKRAAAYS